jgi:hypothetical protein
VGKKLPTKPDFKKLATLTKLTGRYQTQLKRLRASDQKTDSIEKAVKGAMGQLPKESSGSLVIYGEPQSGKTEMMICLTARLLDEGHRTIVHLLNDSVDLLGQNLARFVDAGLAPAPKNASEVSAASLASGQEIVLFCKKNAGDLRKLIKALGEDHPVVIIDDEADYATPNSKVNQKKKTKINELVEELIGAKGIYIGVTATPARLNLNNTFDNRTETWVKFPTHAAYTGQDVFFPIEGLPKYRLQQLSGPGSPKDARLALARFLVTVAYLNTTKNEDGRYSLLVHTSGKTDDHKDDRKIIEELVSALSSGGGAKFKDIVTVVYEQARLLYPDIDPNILTGYVISNATRSIWCAGGKPA